MLYLGVGDAIIHSVQRGRTVEIDTISGRRINSVRFGDPRPTSPPIHPAAPTTLVGHGRQEWMAPVPSRSDGTRRPVRRAMISAQIDTAVSSGVRAPMSRPIGDMQPIELRRARARRLRPGAAIRLSCVVRLPITPM